MHDHEVWPAGLRLGWAPIRNRHSAFTEERREQRLHSLEQGEDKLGQGGTPGEAMAFEQWWTLKLKDLKLVPPGNNPRLPLPQRQLNMLLDPLVKWLLPGQLPSPPLLDLDMDFDLWNRTKGTRRGAVITPQMSGIHNQRCHAYIHI